MTGASHWIREQNKTTLWFSGEYPGFASCGIGFVRPGSSRLSRRSPPHFSRTGAGARRIHGDGEGLERRHAAAEHKGHAGHAVAVRVRRPGRRAGGVGPLPDVSIQADKTTLRSATGPTIVTGYCVKSGPNSSPGPAYKKIEGARGNGRRVRLCAENVVVDQVFHQFLFAADLGGLACGGGDVSQGR